MIVQSHISRITQYSRCLLSWALLIFVSCHALNQPPLKWFSPLWFFTRVTPGYIVSLMSYETKWTFWNTVHGSPNKREFTCVRQCLREKGSFPNTNRHALRQVKRNVEKDENVVDVTQRKPCIIDEELLPTSLCRSWGSGERYTQKECIRTLSRAFSILNLRTYVGCKDTAARFVLTPIWFVPFCAPMKPIILVMESTIQETPIYGIVLIHMERSQAANNSFSETCGVIGDWSIHLPATSYAIVLQLELPALIENVPLQTRLQICYKHEGALLRFIQYLKLKVPNRWIGQGGAQNWPPRSSDVGPSDYHVRGYMKAMVSTHKANTRK